MTRFAKFWGNHEGSLIGPVDRGLLPCFPQLLSARSKINSHAEWDESLKHGTYGDCGGKVDMKMLLPGSPSWWSWYRARTFADFELFTKRERCCRGPELHHGNSLLCGIETKCPDLLQAGQCGKRERQGLDETNTCITFENGNVSKPWVC